MLQYTTGHGVGLREFGGFPMTPAVVLPPLTLVDVLGATNPKDFGQFNTTEWLKVKVEQGPFAGREGYLPATAIANCNWDLSYTAVKYGKVAKNPGQDPVVWEDVCEHCHETPETHVLPETSYGDKGGVAQQLSADTYLQPRGTNQDARRVKDTLEDLKNSFGQKDKGRFFQTGLMIGVLHASGGKPWASHSGGGDIASFKEVVESMGFRYARGLTKTSEIWTRGFKPATDKDVYVTVENGNRYGPYKVQGFDYQCAAPRLIQAAVHEYEYPIAMTEIFFKPGEGSHGHTIPACNKCRGRVPYMLCNI